MSKKPRLYELLEINAIIRGLTDEERREAIALMGEGNGPDGKRCVLCDEEGVGGGWLCAGHAYYALATRK